MASMHKLRLDIDALAVDSFEIDQTLWAEAGTVRAHQDAGDAAGKAAEDARRAATAASNCATCDTCVGETCVV
jgi:hypothetical protein